MPITAILRVRTSSSTYMPRLHASYFFCNGYTFLSPNHDGSPLPCESFHVIQEGGDGEHDVWQIDGGLGDSARGGKRHILHL